jgi:hypothetical protein
MDLKLATTVDILEELSARGMHFAFVGLSLRSHGRPNLYLACHGDSQREVLGLLSILRRRIRRGQKRE